jgi:phosphoribosylanthranilate isomerase
MKVKICGITQLADARLCDQLGADYIGLNFVRRSPRFISFEKAKTIISELTYSRAVGVFVETDLREALEIARALQLAAIQVYYPVTQQIEDVEIIQAVPVHSEDSLSLMDNSSADYFLLDACKSGMFGGMGLAFDWSLLPGDKRKLFLAGGITSDNIEQALAQNTYGIDICSGVEKTPGIKDPEKLKTIFEKIRV